MKFTDVLLRQRIRSRFVLTWLYQKKRNVVKDHVEDSFRKAGINCVDALEVVKPPKLKTEDAITPPTKEDKNKYLYMGENHLLLEGTSQAQVLTKTVFIEQLPDKIMDLVNSTQIPESVDYQVKKTILSAHMFDCEQKRLPKLKPPPDRPAWNYPRVFGITDSRRNYIMTNKLVSIVERHADLGLTLERQVTQDVDSSLTVEKDGEIIQMDQRTSLFVSSLRALPPAIDARETAGKTLPDLYPIKHTVSLHSADTIKGNIFPMNLKQSKVYHPHTLFQHFNETECTNLYELEVREKQMCGRTLMHAFTVAAAYARETYGDVKTLPFPVTLQCVQSDGRLFHFGVFQLNTLNLDGSEGTKNVWWSVPRMKLFHECKYIDGIPVLRNYNSEVYKYLNAFYNNQ